MIDVCGGDAARRRAGRSGHSPGETARRAVQRINRAVGRGGRGEIEPAVPVVIAGGEHVDRPANGDVLLDHPSGGRAVEHRDDVDAAAGDGDVEPAVVVEVGSQHALRMADRTEPLLPGDPASAVAVQNPPRAGRVFRDDEVEHTVAIAIAQRHAAGIRPGHRIRALHEIAAAAGAEQHRDPFEIGVGNHEIGPAVAVEIAGRHLERSPADPNCARPHEPAGRTESIEPDTHRAATGPGLRKVREPIAIEVGHGDRARLRHRLDVRPGEIQHRLRGGDCAGGQEHRGKDQSAHGVVQNGQ